MKNAPKLLVILPVLVAVGLALFRAFPPSDPSVQPPSVARPVARPVQPDPSAAPFSSPSERRFLGSISFNLPAEFQAVSGYLHLLCQGPPSRTQVREIPKEDRAAPLAALVPAGPGPYRLEEAEDFGRPALWAFGAVGALACPQSPGSACPAGTDEIQVHLVLDFESGALVLSRLLPAGRLEEERPVFAAEARRLAEKYAWGHEGGGPEERHSLQGRLKLDQNCRQFRGRVRFTAPKAVLEVSRETQPPAPEDLEDHRLLRSGPRNIDGRPGREWAAQGRDPASGESVLAAAWIPESAEEAALFLSASSEALDYWEAILDSIRFLEPEALEEATAQEAAAVAPEPLQAQPPDPAPDQDPSPESPETLEEEAAIGLELILGMEAEH